MKNNQTHYEINLYILTDSNGEWWEKLKSDGTTDTFKAGSSTLKKAKTFKSKELAIKFAKEEGFIRFKVEALTSPPEWGKGLTWQQETVYSSKSQQKS